MRIKELEQPLNSMRQDLVDKWLDGEKWCSTPLIIYSIYGEDGVKKFIKRKR